MNQTWNTPRKEGKGKSIKNSTSPKSHGGERIRVWEKKMGGDGQEGVRGGGGGGRDQGEMKKKRKF